VKGDPGPCHSLGGEHSLVFHGSTPEAYGQWLRRVIETTCREYERDERIVFVNAWNEWAEGAHLEPDERWGVRYLEERSGLSSRKSDSLPPVVEQVPQSLLKRDLDCPARGVPDLGRVSIQDHHVGRP
jgi:glycosyl transferase family WbsX